MRDSKCMDQEDWGVREQLGGVEEGKMSISIKGEKINLSIKLRKKEKKKRKNNFVMYHSALW